MKREIFRNKQYVDSKAGGINPVKNQNSNVASVSSSCNLIMVVLFTFYSDINISSQFDVVSGFGIVKRNSNMIIKSKYNNITYDIKVTFSSDSTISVKNTASSSSYSPSYVVQEL